jgi:predicted alpha/beta-fold hydrolase
LAGELNAIARSFLIGVIAISPPVDLYSSVQMLGRAENAIYEKYFYKELRSDVHYRHKTFKQLPPLRLPRGLKMYEFDQLYTAPTHGFKNAVDYYSKCSAFQYVGDIEVPSKILFAKDDPIVAASSLDHCRLPSNVAIFKTANGGHLGYLGHPSSKGGLFWLDSQLVDWITELAK